MLVTVAVCVVAALVVVGLVWAVLSHDRVDETERFHRASEITSSWAAPGPATHPAGVPERRDDSGQD